MQVKNNVLKWLYVAVFAAVLSACATTEPADDMGDNDMGPVIEEDDSITGPGAVPRDDVDAEEIDEGPIPGTQEHLNATIGDRVFFAFDSSELSSEARRTLQRQAGWLRQFSDVDVTIEGHADERGTREYNIALGDRRATAVKNYLVALGISADRVNTISYGKERPVALGSNEAAWAQNRRGVMVVSD